jgi:ankyrin repeat protein
MTRAIGNPNYQGPFGNTLLHGAVVSGDLTEVRRLLSAGANPTIANRDGKTALQAAAILGHAELYRVLADRSDEHLERLLDQALEATFPASDPVSITQPSASHDNDEGDDQRKGDGIKPVILRIHNRG